MGFYITALNPVKIETLKGDFSSGLVILYDPGA
jgi:hypothetical protein